MKQFLMQLCFQIAVLFWFISVELNVYRYIIFVSSVIGINLVAEILRDIKEKKSECKRLASKG